MKLLKSLFIVLTVSMPLLANGLVYEAKKGDNFMSISARFYGTPKLWKKIVYSNPSIENNKSLNAGELVFVTEVDESRADCLYKNCPALSGAALNKVLSMEGNARFLGKSATQKPKVSIGPVGPSVPKVSVKVVKSAPRVRRKPRTSEKYNSLQLEFVKLKEENEALKNEFQFVTKGKKKIRRWSSERKNLLNELRSLRKQYSKLEKQNSSLNNKSDYFVPSNLSLGLEQVLKDKSKILTQRLWIEKNKEIGDCRIEFGDNMKEQKVKLNKLVEKFQQDMGHKSIVIDSTENAVVFIFPGDTVKGVDAPILNERYYKYLHDIAGVVRELPIKEIQIGGNYYKNSLKNESGRKVSRMEFSIRQGEAVQKYLTDVLDLTSRSMTIGSYAPFKSELGQNKAFNIKIQFEKKVEIGSMSRNLASIESSYKVLNNIGNEVSKFLDEPKYSKIVRNENSLEVHLGRHYFFNGTSGVLKPKGRDMLRKLFNIFSLSSDVGFYIQWAPGQREAKVDKNLSVGLNQLKSLKTYVDKKQVHLKEKVEYSLASRYNSLKEALNANEDKFNKRIIFKVTPYSANARYHTP